MHLGGAAPARADRDKTQGQGGTMASDVRCEELSFASAEGSATIVASVWWPPEGTEPRGVVQLVHGMCEHIGRYDAFARYLAEAGLVVCGHDQLGHGRSCAPERWGCLPGRDGANDLVEDVDTLRRLVDARCPGGIPHILFGHSMGSFVVRCYVARYAYGLAGAIVCGTGWLSPVSQAACHALVRAAALVRGEDHKSELFHSLAEGSYGKAIPDAQTPLDWLSYNRDNVRAYEADPACGFTFSLGGYAALTDLTRACCSVSCARAVPAGLPLYYVAGADDPVGECGRGVQRALQMALDAGSVDARMRLWPHMRHEILNEDGREAVYADLLAWIEEHL